MNHEKQTDETFTSRVHPKNAN